MPAGSTRDYARLISMIKSVAVLRHRNREQDDNGRLIAEIEDYALVHELVGQDVRDLGHQGVGQAPIHIKGCGGAQAGKMLRR